MAEAAHNGFDLGPVADCRAGGAERMALAQIGGMAESRARIHGNITRPEGGH